MELASSGCAPARRRRTGSWHWPLVLALAAWLVIASAVHGSGAGAAMPAGQWSVWVHGVFEFVSIVCFGVIAAVGWNSHGVARPARPTVLAVAFLGVTALDLLHVLTVPVGIGDARVTSETLWAWLFARAFAIAGLGAASLLNAEATISVRAARRLLAAGVALAAVAVWLVMFAVDALPPLFGPGGLAPIKIAIECGLAAGGALAALRFLGDGRRSNGADDPSAMLASRDLFAAAAITAMSELFLAQYTSAEDPMVAFGHLYKLIAAVILYQALLAKGVRAPFDALTRSTDALRERQLQLDAIIDSAMDAVVTVDEENRIVVFNRAAESVFGCEARNAIGGSLDRFVPTAARATHTGRMRAFGTTPGGSRRMGASSRIVTALRADGAAFPIQASISHSRSSGRMLYTVILRDVTQEQAADRALREAFAEMQALAARLQHAREEERSHVALELHDDHAQALAALRMNVVALKAALDGRSPASDELLSSIDRISSGAILSVRRLLADLRPPDLDNLGLVGALEWLCSDVDRSKGLRCTVDGDGNAQLGRLDPAVSLNLYRLTQEALTNVARHAEATKAAVSLQRDGDDLVLSIVDDGKGYDVGAPRRRDAFGLIGMRERARAIGGSLEVESNPGAGTRIAVRLRAPRRSDDERTVADPDAPASG